jgi:hypothetical protein
VPAWTGGAGKARNRAVAAADDKTKGRTVVVIVDAFIDS